MSDAGAVRRVFQARYRPARNAVFLAFKADTCTGSVPRDTQHAIRRPELPPLALGFTAHQLDLRPQHLIFTRLYPQEFQCKTSLLFNPSRRE